MKRKYNYRIVKSCRSYSIVEVCQLINVCNRTVKDWIRLKGLEVIDQNSKPYLISGVELKKFLKTKRLNSKVKLNSTQFYCLKCQNAVESIQDKIFIKETGKRFFSGDAQIIVSGECIECHSSIRKFSSSKILSQQDNNFFYNN